MKIHELDNVEVREDGHKYAEEALEKGAAAVVVQKDLGLANQILVENTRSAYAHICAAFARRILRPVCMPFAAQAGAWNIMLVIPCEEHSQQEKVVKNMRLCRKEAESHIVENLP